MLHLIHDISLIGHYKKVKIKPKDLHCNDIPQIIYSLKFKKTHVIYRIKKTQECCWKNLFTILIEVHLHSLDFAKHLSIAQTPVCRQSIDSTLTLCQTRLKVQNGTRDTTEKCVILTLRRNQYLFISDSSRNQRKKRFDCRNKDDEEIFGFVLFSFFEQESEECQSGLKREPP